MRNIKKALNVVTILSLALGMMSVESDSIWYSVAFILIAGVTYLLSAAIEAKQKKECSRVKA